MKYLICIIIFAYIIPGCSASETQHEYSFSFCGHSGVKTLVYDASVKLLELYPSSRDSSITPPEFTIDRDSLASMVFYPPIAIRAGIEGIVAAEFLVDDRGYPSNIKITKEMYNIAEYAVNNVIAMARFHPAMKNGKPVLCNITAVFEFSRGEIIGVEEQ